MALLQISISGSGCMVEALPKACECVEMRWKDMRDIDSLGLAAGLGAYPRMKRLVLESFR